MNDEGSAEKLLNTLLLKHKKKLKGLEPLDERFQIVIEEDSLTSDENQSTSSKPTDLLLVKKTELDIIVFKDSIKRSTFGPDIVHKDEYKVIQMTLKKFGFKACYVIGYSTTQDRSLLLAHVNLDEDYLRYERLI